MLALLGLVAAAPAGHARLRLQSGTATATRLRMPSYPRVLPRAFRGVQVSAERSALLGGSPMVEPPPLSSEPLAFSSVAANAEGGPLQPIRVSNLRAIVPTDLVSAISEPCVAKAGRTMLATANSFAAFSTDSGATFRLIDPAQAFPNANGGFCCDQSVIYDPIHDLFVWVLLYRDDGVSNTVRIAVARGESGVRDGRWELHDVTPATLALPGGRQLDYPQIALSARHLYVSANVFTLDGRQRFTDSAMLRLSLADLAAGGAPAMEFYRTSDGHFTFTPAQGATDEIFWAAHDPKRFAVRVYRWHDDDAIIRFTDVAVRKWARKRDPSCAGPDGRSWCGASDGRIQAGWIAGGVVGFMWNAPQTSGRPFPFVRTLRIDQAARRPIDDADLFSADHALQYPAVGVNARGDVAGIVAVGGGSGFPSVGAFVIPAGAPIAPAIQQLATGDSGPGLDRWGDFYCVRPDYPVATTWVATGHVLRGGDGGEFAQPLVFRLGFADDVACQAEDLCADDGNPCTDDLCRSGACVHEPRDGEECEDGDLCTLGDRCAGTVCVPGAPRACPVGDACTTSSCVATAGCVETPLPGLAGVRCELGQGLQTLPECAGRTIPSSVLSPFETARRLASDPTRASRPPTLRRMLRILAKSAHRAERADVGEQCGEALVERLSELNRIVAALLFGG